jgi:hypothetical protein
MLINQLDGLKWAERYFLSFRSERLLKEWFLRLVRSVFLSWWLCGRGQHDEMAFIYYAGLKWGIHGLFLLGFN